MKKDFAYWVFAALLYASFAAAWQTADWIYQLIKYTWGLQ